jgi:hypothetical protein
MTQLPLISQSQVRFNFTFFRPFYRWGKTHVGVYKHGKEKNLYGVASVYMVFNVSETYKLVQQNKLRVS